MYNIRSTSSSSSSNTTFNPATSKYHVTFAGTTIETTVTDKSATATEWVREIRTTAPVVVGLDVEWRPNFARRSMSSNKSATLQLCVADKCLILQLFHMDEIPNSIRGFLLDPDHVFVGVEVEDDVQKLREEYGLECGRSRDIRAEAEERWPGRFRRAGLKDLAKEICGVEMRKAKHVCMSNWEARVLNEAQVEYACLEGMSCFFRNEVSFWI